MNLADKAPLAERLRPTTLDGFAGQEHLVSPGAPLRKMHDSGQLFSFILWGPPGCGKTTLARIVASGSKSEFISLSAVSSGVKDVRDVIEKARLNSQYFRSTVLFIDEIHRFNKAQQDALLHCVEQGTLTLIGATTENPSFEVITPLLSRCKVYVLNPLDEDALSSILQHGRLFLEKETGKKIAIEDPKEFLHYAGGDARVTLNSLEIALSLAPAPKDNEAAVVIDKTTVRNTFQKNPLSYDRAGEEHHNIASAFIKSLRGSDPDAAVYWCARMLEGGEDPLFIARRMIILASEDIGNANPFALTMALDCFDACDRIGMPEARIILGQTASYLASSEKSNASYKAINEAIAEVKESGALPVPLHLRNAPTKLMKSLDYSKGYKYAHDFEGNFVEQQFLPDAIKDKVFYKPTENGREKSLRDRLLKIWKKKR